MSGRHETPTIAAAASAFRDRTLSPVELTAAVLDRIAATEPLLHAYVEVRAEEAMSAARAAEAAFARGEDAGPLQGIPIGVKDIFDWVGVPTRCGSPMLADAPAADADSVPVARLRATGAVLLGKTVTQEFAAGVVSVPARNPWDPARIPGGSSGGSAAAVAAGSALAALGSDTGGSIRIPASVTGTVGLKPTFGRVSKRGVFPLSWSLDTVGPIARTVEDAALLLNVLAGHDPADPTTARVAVADATSQLPGDRAEPESLAGVRLGVVRGYFYDRLRPGVAAAVEAALDMFRALGAELVEVEWPEAAAGRTAATLISRVEGAAVHAARYRANADAFGAEMRFRIEVGRRLPAADYLTALRARETIKHSAADLFDALRLDALLAPTTPETALRADRLVIDWDDGEEPVTAGYLRLTMPFNATGQPVLSLPCGFDAAGLPVGLQVAGRPFAEAAL
ncbi:MAG TPA: amidase, partial [Methylomirabilota bacterium]|nr:amidase [Methylomirabilota bacterium]